MRTIWTTILNKCYLMDCCHALSPPSQQMEDHCWTSISFSLLLKIKDISFSVWCDFKLLCVRGERELSLLCGWLSIFELIWGLVRAPPVGKDLRSCCSFIPRQHAQHFEHWGGDSPTLIWSHWTDTLSITAIL